MLMRKDGIFRSVSESRKTEFLEKGYEVVGPPVETNPPKIENTGTHFDGMTVDDLIAYAKEKGYDIGRSTGLKGIYEKIVSAEKQQ